MTHPLPYGVDSWIPVLRGGYAPKLFLDAADARSKARLAQAWKKLPAGGRVVLQSVAAPGSKPILAPLEQGLASSGHVERFVVFPGTGGSFTLLPTRDGAALRGGMALLPSCKARGRALWALLHAASPFGVARRLGHPELAIWTKGPFDEESENLPVLPVAGSIAVAAGVPNKNQKVIVRALDRRGNARAILKLGFSERSDDAVAREATALTTVSALLDDRSPKLLTEGRRAGRLDPAIDPDWHQEYTTLAEALENAADGFALPTTFAHGDFTPWNMVIKRGRIRAFDWEYFSKRAPALYDIFHFHIQSGVLVKHHSGERIFDDLDALFSGPASQVVTALELRREEILQLAALYVLHEGVCHELEERRNPSPFTQAICLRHARRALCRRLAGLIAERRLPGWTATPPGPGSVAA